MKTTALLFLAILTLTSPLAVEAHSAAMLPKYEVIIGDVDNLVIEVLKRASLNPKFFVIGLHAPAAREAMAYQNPQAAGWGL